MLLRYFLDNEASAQVLQSESKKIVQTGPDLVSSWLAIIAFKKTSKKHIHHNDALNIYTHHIKQTTSAAVDKISSGTFTATIEEATCANHFDHEDCLDEGCPLCPHGFDWYLKFLFMKIYESVYIPFVSNNQENLAKLVRAVELSVNPITVSDFKYDKILGAGSFGVVVKCIKISTGKLRTVY